MPVFSEDYEPGYRQENKYYISLEEASALRERLRKIMKKDPHSDYNWSYLITSVYFDDYNNTSFNDAVDGMKIKKKYRIRAYNHSDSFITLERKYKKGNSSKKTQLIITRDDYDNIISGNPGVLKKYGGPLARDFLYDVSVGGYRPKTIVEYDREIYINDISDVRITFDKNIKGSVSGFDMFKPHTLIPTLPPYVVLLEVKFNHVLPDFIRQILPLNVMQKIANCKYALGRTYI